MPRNNLRPTNTDFEDKALGTAINLSDAHCRITPPPEIDRLVASFPAYVEQARSIGEKAASAKFLNQLFHSHKLPTPPRCLISYSTSCLVLSLASVLHEFGSQVLIEVPSFDNIRDLLARSRCLIRHVAEGAFRQIEATCEGEQRIVWITNPNNPTGHIYTEKEIDQIATYCERTGGLLVIDSCFRTFSRTLTATNYHRILSSHSRLRWLVLEDTGKFLPVADLKAGIMYCSKHTFEIARSANSELLLNVSPALLLFLGECYMNINVSSYLDLIDFNRRSMLAAITRFPHLCETAVVSPDVPLLWFRGRDPGFGRALYARLVEYGVHILPGGAFFTTADDGDRFFRIALNRDSTTVLEGRRRITDSLMAFD